jgi:small-conductance mechanosensitive channel
VDLVNINSAPVTQLWISALLFLPKLAVAILIFVGFWLGGEILRRVIGRFGVNRALAPDITNLIRQSATIVLLMLGAISALGTLGIDMGAMIAGLGLTGFALGFALKDIVSNLLSGFLLLIYKPFGRSDVITVAGEKGMITEINLRYTVLKSPGKIILIPNQNLFSNIVVVQTSDPGISPQGTEPPAAGPA